MTEGSSKVVGNLLAAFTACVWGVTFVSSKYLLFVMTPSQLLLSRFLLGYFLLWILHPHPLCLKEKSDLWDFAGAGFFGVFLYYFLENSSLAFTYAGSVSVIVSTAPLFTILMCCTFFRIPMHKRYIFGFLLSLGGVALISLSGMKELNLHPKGDLMALLAASMWGCYSLFTTRITRKGYGMLCATRVMFFFALLCMAVVCMLEPNHFALLLFLRPPYLCHLLFLGLIASGICFVTWNLAMKYAGVVEASCYIYASPVVTLLTGALFLHEKCTFLSLLGSAMVIGGMVASGVRE